MVYAMKKGFNVQFLERFFKDSSAAHVTETNIILQQKVAISFLIKTHYFLYEKFKLYQNFTTVVIRCQNVPESCYFSKINK